ncbi:hypothetical protein OH492_19315 [Vibrio chagasii]|nr:hypothetical protein [Vibrio chagasii]
MAADEKNEIDSKRLVLVHSIWMNIKSMTWCALKNKHYWKDDVQMDQVVFDTSQRGTGACWLLRNE